MKGETEMLKKRIIAVIAGLALLIGIVGSSGIVADSLGFSVTLQVNACNNGSGTGGGC